MIKVSVWIWMKINLFQFIEGHTGFSISQHVDVSLTLYELIENVFHTKLHTISKDEPKTHQTWRGAWDSHSL